MLIQQSNFSKNEKLFIDYYTGTKHTQNMMMPWGIIIVVGCLLIGVYAMADYIIPDVICRIIPHTTNVKLYSGQYNPDIFGDICSAIH